MGDVKALLKKIRNNAVPKITAREIAETVQVSLVSIFQWEAMATLPRREHQIKVHNFLVERGIITDQMTPGQLFDPIPMTPGQLFDPIPNSGE